MEKDRIVQIKLNHVTKKWNKTESITDISFSLSEGEVIACVGDRKAGGRIIVSLLAGLMRPRKGSIEYGIGLSGNLYSKLAYVPGTPAFFQGKKVVDLAVQTQKLHKAYCRNNFYRLCEVFDINPDMKLSVMTLRQNRIVSFIINIMWEPGVLIIDDVENYMKKEDLTILENELQMLTEQGTACFIECGKAESVSNICHRVMVLENGRLEHMIDRGSIEEEYVLTVPEDEVSKLAAVNIEEIVRKDGRVICLCRDSNEQIVHTLTAESVKNVLVERLTLDEQIFEDYARWM